MITSTLESNTRVASLRQPITYRGTGDHVPSGTGDHLHWIAHPAIVPPSGTSVRRVAELVIRQHRLAVNVVMEVGGWSVIKRYVEAGVGISIVPELCLTERDRVWRIPVDRYLPDRRYGVLMRRGQVPSLAAERFVQLLDPALRSGSC